MRVRILYARPDRPDLEIGNVYELPEGEAYIQSGDAEQTADAVTGSGPVHLPAPDPSAPGGADEVAMIDAAREAAVARRGRPPGR
jgi:hypothetical protein